MNQSKPLLLEEDIIEEEEQLPEEQPVIKQTQALTQKRIVNELGPMCEKQGNFPDEKCNKVKLIKETIEYNELEKTPDTNEYLYPTLNDPNFVVKIAEKKRI